MTKRLTYWSQILKQNKSKLFNASHVVMSIPSRPYLQDMKTIKKEFKRVQKEVGVNASAVVLHPFRFVTGKADPYPSPHFHAIAFGWIDNTKEVYEKTGWLVHKISTLKNEVDYFRTCKYLLTHSGVRPGTHAVVYTGKISYSKLKLPEEETEEPQCPHCDLKLERLRLIPHLLDKPPPFDPGFIGLSAFSAVEPIEDYDYHYYDDSWNVLTTRQIRQMNEADQDGQKRLDQEILQKATHSQIIDSYGDYPKLPFKKKMTDLQKWVYERQNR